MPCYIIGKPFSLWHSSILLESTRHRSASVFPPSQICIQLCRTWGLAFGPSVMCCRLPSAAVIQHQAAVSELIIMHSTSSHFPPGCSAFAHIRGRSIKQLDGVTRTGMQINAQYVVPWSTANCDATLNLWWLNWHSEKSGAVAESQRAAHPQCSWLYCHIRAQPG